MLSDLPKLVIGSCSMLSSEVLPLTKKTSWAGRQHQARKWRETRKGKIRHSDKGSQSV